MRGALTCVDLQTAALAGEQRRGAVLLQPGVGGGWRPVLLPVGEADLRHQGLGPPQTPVVGEARGGGVLERGGVDGGPRGGLGVLRFVFSLRAVETEGGGVIHRAGLSLTCGNGSVFKW